MTITIDGRNIGPGHKPYIIAEAADAHMGSMDYAKALVLHSKDRPTQDYSIEARGANGACNHYLPASDFRKPPDVAQRPAHDFIKGLV